MNRRGFLTAMLTACAAPAIVRADSLMRIVPTSTIFYGSPPAGELIRVLSWRGYFKMPENIEGTYYAEETSLNMFNFDDRSTCMAVALGFLANTPNELYIADSKLIASWERV